MAPKTGGQQPALVKKSSEVTATDKSGQVFKGFYIWSDVALAVQKDPDLLFAKCLVLPGSTSSVFRCRQVEPYDQTEEEFDVKQVNAFNYNSNTDCMSISDIGMMPHTNVPCVLDFLRQRFSQKQIYSTADPLLVAINPFQDLGNTTDAIIAEYRDTSDVSKKPPHVFSIARTAQENLHGVKKSQTIIVCGESGAGKTEATKQIMRYFAACKGTATDTRIQKAVLAANPVLEAFGNAKTIRNNNSSRFGRFMRLVTGPNGGIQYGSVRNFLLEKSRVVTQVDNERSYHIFYQLLKGSDSSLKSKLGIKDLKSYRFLNPSCTDVDNIDDVTEFKDVNVSFDYMGLTAAQKEAIFSIVAGVLELGNVKFIAKEKQGIPDAAEIDPESRETLTHACKLLYLNEALIEEGLTIKISSAGGETVRGCWKKDEAEILRESLAKAIYEKLFFWIVRCLNETIKPPDDFGCFMGMLDIFGFEVFKHNSLEQLFINITNEMLQKNFIDVVFDRETKLYREEGISAADLTWTSNEQVIVALAGKKNSIMAALEDQCLAPGGSDEKFLSNALSNMKGNTKFFAAKVGGNINFVVAHTIGDIQYTATSFLLKNKDVLRAELAEVVQASENEVVNQLFAGVVIEKGKLAKGQLIGSQFMGSLSALMELIDSTEPHFIRCVKPNEEKAPMKYTMSKVLVQLHALSILEALQLRNLGYSYRRPFKEFLFQFKFVDLGVSENKSLEQKVASEALFASANIKTGWQIGKTMVFMKPTVMKELTRAQRESLAAWEPLVVLIECAYMRKKNITRIADRRGSILRIQAHIRKILFDKVDSVPAIECS